MMKRKPSVARGREIWDVYDLKLALLDLKRLGFDLEVTAEVRSDSMLPAKALIIAS